MDDWLDEYLMNFEEAGRLAQIKLTRIDPRYPGEWIVTLHGERLVPEAVGTANITTRDPRARELASWLGFEATLLSDDPLVTIHRARVGRRRLPLGAIKINRGIGLRADQWRVIDQLASEHRCSLGDVIGMILDKFTH